MNFEYLLRKQIRKRILLEFKKRLNEEDDPEESGGPSSEELIATAESFEEKAKSYTNSFPNADFPFGSPDLRSRAEVNSLADKLKIGTGDAFGAIGNRRVSFGGTRGNKETLLEAFGKIKCMTDLNNVDDAFKSRNVGNRGWEETLDKTKEFMDPGEVPRLTSDVETEISRINKTLFYLGDNPVTEDKLKQSIEEIGEISSSIGSADYIESLAISTLEKAKNDNEYSEIIELISSQYQDIASDLREKAESVEEESNTETETDCNALESEIGGIDSSSVGEYVLKIRKVMEMYRKKFLKDKLGEPIKTDKSLWDSDLQGYWNLMVDHFLSRPHLSDYDKNSFGLDTNDAEDATGSWNTMSDVLIGDFPSYTRGPRGCLIFLMDAYCGKAKWGKQPAPVRRRRSSSRRRDGDGGSSDTPPRQRTVTEDRGQISIQLNQQFNGSRTLRGSGFKVRGQPGENPDRFMANSLRTFITPTTGREGHPGGRITFYFEVDKDKKEITGISVQGGIGKWKGLQGGQSRKVKAALLRAAQNLIFPKKNSRSPYASENGNFDPRERGRNKYAIKATFIFEPGYYG